MRQRTRKFESGSGYPSTRSVGENGGSAVDRRRHYDRARQNATVGGRRGDVGSCRVGRRRTGGLRAGRGGRRRRTVAEPSQPRPVRLGVPPLTVALVAASQLVGGDRLAAARLTASSLAGSAGSAPGVVPPSPLGASVLEPDLRTTSAKL